MAKLETATVLAFERKLDISDAVFKQYDRAAQNSRPEVVKVREKSVRGTILNRQKSTVANNPVKLDAEIQKVNLQTVDVATLDSHNNILEVSFTCKVIPFDGAPSVCNNPGYQDRLQSIVSEYLNEHGVDELAQRYATNILNGRWLWRNRIGSKTIGITVSCSINGEDHLVSTTNARQLSLKDFDQPSDEINTVARWIASGLRGETFTLLNVTAHAEVGYGQEVYPSQELILDTGKTKRKVLYVVDEKTQQAGMHSQKIGNALRTIDTWYDNDPHMPIAVEPYGAVTTLGTAFRQPKVKMDFYSLFDHWVLKEKKPAVEQQHYVMGVLIRGGVFGASGKE